MSNEALIIMSFLLGLVLGGGAVAKMALASFMMNTSMAKHTHKPRPKPRPKPKANSNKVPMGVNGKPVRVNND